MGLVNDLQICLHVLSEVYPLAGVLQLGVTPCFTQNHRFIPSLEKQKVLEKKKKKKNSRNITDRIISTTMVSFSCEVCNDTIIKKKLDQHTQRCYGAYFTCIDCSTTFEGTEYRKHTSCITEDEKYQKSLYKKKPAKGQPKRVEPKKEEPKKEVKKEEPKKEVKKEEPKKEVKKSKPAKEFPLDSVSGTENLYKVLKKSSKGESKKLKEILNSLKVTKVDGKYIIEQ